MEETGLKQTEERAIQYRQWLQATLLASFGQYLMFHTLFSAGPGSNETFRVPWMYNTEYQFYGSEKSVTV